MKVHLAFAIALIGLAACATTPPPSPAAPPPWPESLQAKASVSRADLARLLDSELRPWFDSKLAPKMPPARFVPLDAVGDPNQEAIVAVLALDLAGLQPAQDLTHQALLFRPNDYVDRGQFALLLTELLVRLGELAPQTSTAASSSPVADISASDPLYAAVVTTSVRGLLKLDKFGNFSASAKLSGGDAVEAIAAIKVLLQQR